MIVAGGRKFSDKNLFRQKMNEMEIKYNPPLGVCWRWGDYEKFIKKWHVESEGNFGI